MSLEKHCPNAPLRVGKLEELINEISIDDDTSHSSKILGLSREKRLDAEKRSYILAAKILTVTGRMIPCD
jgi:hypothetical protein